MSDQPDLFPRPESAENELKAHAALYAARAEAHRPAAPVFVVAPARIVPQGGAALVRRERQRLMGSQAQVVVPAVERFQRERPAAEAQAPVAPAPGQAEAQSLQPVAVLRLKLSDLPKLMQQRLEPPAGRSSR